MRSSPDLLTRFLRLILRVFFRSVEVVGVERLPLGKPMVLVANHVNGVQDEPSWRLLTGVAVSF